MNSLLYIALGALSGLVIVIAIVVSVLSHRKRLMKEAARPEPMHVSVTLSSADSVEEEDEPSIRHQQ